MAAKYLDGTGFERGRQRLPALSLLPGHAKVLRRIIRLAVQGAAKPETLFAQGNP
ncbi:hypothetical protein D3C72_2467420 [compost metagenome]